jgi:hypothetical protein
MATSQRVSRGFHRLGLFLAAIPLIVGVFAIAYVLAQAERANRQHQQLLCAHDYLVQERLLLSDDEMKDVKPWQIPWKLYEQITVGTVCCGKRTYMEGTSSVLCWLCIRDDRLARSTSDLYRIVSYLNEKGVAFKVTDDPTIDTTSRTGKLVMGLLALIAEFENDSGESGRWTVSLRPRTVA